MQEVYEPLDVHEKTIRLIRLVPSLSTIHPVSCRLEEVRLVDGPRFDAISYSWGAPQCHDVVLVNGTRIEVRPNLHLLLRTLCAQEEGQTPAIWVDAICINESDSVERAWQLPSMGLIYAIAQEVVIRAGAMREDEEDIIMAIKDEAFCFRHILNVDSLCDSAML
jgi:hypothetical protein